MLGNTSISIIGPTICVIGVCTRERPHSFHECLRSLMALDSPQNVHIEIIVVDNEEVPQYASQIADLNRAPLLHRIHYIHEARRGIVYARNAVLDQAERLGAHWIAMIDDDQTAPPNWLIQMFEAQLMTNADIVEASVEMAYPTPLPKWAFPKEKHFGWKYRRRSAATNGVMFNAECLYHNGRRNCFDVRYNMTGGEDREFFRHLVSQGAFICKTPNAILTEYLQTTKLTFHAQLYRTFAGELIDARQRNESDGKFRNTIRKGGKAIYHVFGGIVIGLLIPAFVLSPRRRDKQILKSARSFARVAGIGYGLFGKATPQPYERVHSN